RLDEVVVGSGVEPQHPIVDLVPGGEHEHPRPLLAEQLHLTGSDTAAYVHARSVGEVPIQQQQVVLRRRQLQLRPGDRGSDVDVVARPAQPAGDRRGELRFFFDQQQPHPRKRYRKPEETGLGGSRGEVLRIGIAAWHDALEEGTSSMTSTHQLLARPAGAARLVAHPKTCTVPAPAGGGGPSSTGHGSITRCGGDAPCASTGPNTRRFSSTWTAS